MLNKFKKLKGYEQLGKRTKGFEFIINYLDSINHEFSIIETGTARIQDNWEGDGQSTLIWDFVTQNLPSTAVSIDINCENINIARNQTKNIQYIISDSVKALSKINVNDCYLLYLDSFDYSKELHFESCFHHIMELATVYALLPSGCMIAVDDRLEENKGKHVFVEKFMNQLGLVPVFKEYQIIWIKP
jgi:hypothetical protein